jgi:hypothetical protein
MRRDGSVFLPAFSGSISFRWFLFTVPAVIFTKWLSRSSGTPMCNSTSGRLVLHIITRVNVLCPVLVLYRQGGSEPWHSCLFRHFSRWLGDPAKRIICPLESSLTPTPEASLGAPPGCQRECKFSVQSFTHSISVIEVNGRDDVDSHWTNPMWEGMIKQRWMRTFLSRTNIKNEKRPPMLEWPFGADKLRNDWLQHPESGQCRLVAE